MLTDSRSFMSYPRHEYFRRVLCNMLGEEMENGELPRRQRWSAGWWADICFANARRYLGLDAVTSAGSGLGARRSAKREGGFASAWDMWIAIDNKGSL